MDKLRELHDTTWRAVAERTDRRGGRKVAIPEHVACDPTEEEARHGHDFPVLGQLQEALALARSGPLAHLVGSIGTVLGDLVWSQNAAYDETNASRAFLDGYAYAQLSGPAGPIACEAPRGGFLLLGAGVHYPGHSHAPQEVYLVFTPGARWRLDRSDWFDVEAGDLVVHDPWEVHAMRAGDRPLLAFAGWLEPGRRDAIRWAPGA